jgi:voltage-gated sodium channel
MTSFKKLFLTEKNILAVIAINSVIIFLLYFPQIKENTPDFFRALEYLDVFCVIIFLIEAIVKIREYGFKGYFSQGWNVFDFIIVVASLPALLIFFPSIVLPTSTSFLKILRLGRMTRLFRMMTFIPRMNMIMEGLGRALKASVFVILALLLFNFLIALFSCHFFGHRVPEMFGDPLISMYHIFQMFTVEGWNEIPATVAAAYDAEGSSPSIFSPKIMAGLTRFYFIIIVSLGGIFGMSLANAVFVDEMTSDNNSELETKLDAMQKQLEEMKALLEKRK